MSSACLLNTAFRIGGQNGFLVSIMLVDQMFRCLDAPICHCHQVDSSDSALTQIDNIDGSQRVGSVSKEKAQCIRTVHASVLESWPI